MSATEFAVIYAIVGVVVYVAVTALSVMFGMLMYDRMKRNRESEGAGSDQDKRFYSGEVARG